MKQFEALYINGKLVDIGSADITLEWKSVMLSNISKLKTNHSYTIKLPMTAVNRKVFDSAEDAMHDAYVTASGGLLTAGRRMSARYYCNGIDLLGNASAFLTGVDKDCYKVVLTWGSLSMLEAVISEERTLPDIFDNEETPPTTCYWEHWPNEVIIDRLGRNVVHIQYIKTKNGDINAGLYNYTGELPSMKVTWIIDRILSKYGVSYDFTKDYNGTVKTEELLDSLYIPMVSLKDSKYVQGYNHAKWYVNQVESFPDEQVSYEGYTELHGSSPLSLERISPLYPEGESSPVIGWYGRQMDMKYRIKTHLRVFVDCYDIITGEAWVMANVKLAVCNGSGENISVVTSFDPSSCRYIGARWSGMLTVHVYEVMFDYDEWLEVDDGDTPGGDYWQSLSYDEALLERQRRVLRITQSTARLDVSGEEYVFYDLRNTLDPNWSNWVDVCPVLTTGKVWNDTYAAHTDIDTKTPLYLEPNYPELKPIDFLKAVFYLIGAFPVVVGDKLKLTLYTELVDNIGIAADWSKYVIDDNDIPDQVDFELTEWAQKNWMRYKDDDEVSPKFSGYFTIDDDYLSASADIFTLPFHGCEYRGGVIVPIFEPGKVLWQVAVPVYSQGGMDGHDGYVFKEGKPCILSTYKIDYPSVEYNGAYTPARTVTYYDSESLNFADPNSTVRRRYEVFAEMLRHPYVVTVSMEIDDFTLGRLDMSVPVFIRQYGSYFGVISVKRRNSGLCTVKLLKIPNTLITG